MDKSTTQEITEGVISDLKAKFGLEKWEIRFTYDTTLSEDDGTVFGKCNSSYDYNDANITLNPEAFETEEDVLGTIRHELFHVVLSPYDLFIECVGTLELDEQTQKLLARILTNVREKTVINLERMYQGLSKSNESSQSFEDSL